MTLLASLPALAGAPRTWEVPGALEAVDVPGRTVAGGMPVAMHAVRSKHDAPFLQAHLLKQFQSAGLWLGPQTQLTVHRQVTGLDVDARVVHTVFLQTNPDKSTTVIFSETFAAERGPQGRVTFAPLLPGAQKVTLSSTEGVELATYRVRATEGEVHAFYGETLAKAGWVRDGARWTRGSRSLVVQARQRGDETAVGLTHR
ncbi:MAG: hypothetical protein JNK82_44725 [Myxococcaceae bacterium]|nr:hypothetical protein [Myxococcaceae bacterium]